MYFRIVTGVDAPRLIFLVMLCSWLHFRLGLAVLMAAVFAHGQDKFTPSEVGPEWFHDPWRTNDGLPNNDVTGIVQASDGALMVGTLSGLARFDGLRFRTVPVSVPGTGSEAVAGVCPSREGGVWTICRQHAVALIPGKTAPAIPLPSIPPGSKLTAMFLAPDGAMWVSYDSGTVVRVFDGSATAAKVAPGLATNFANTAAIDAKGTIWAAGPGTLARWSGGRFSKVSELPPRRAALASARDGGLWIGAGRTLLRFTEEKGLVQIAELGAVHARTRIGTMLEDSAGQVWCGTYSGGLHCWNGRSFERVHVAHHDVWALAEDVEHNIWIGTGGNGLVRVRPRVLTTLDERNGPVNQTPRSLCVDANQQVWVVTQTGDVYVRTAGNWRQVDLSAELRTAGATCVAADANGNVWVACSENKVSRWDGKAFHDEPLPPAKRTGRRIFAMMLARDGSLWIGRNEELIQQTRGGWKTYPPVADREYITTLAQDRAGDVWAGTLRGNLFRVQGAGLARDSRSTGGGAVRCLLPAPDGALWIGRATRLARLKAGQWSELTSAHGLDQGGAMSQLTLDEFGRMWIGVDQGILLARLEDLNAAADGMVERIHFSPYINSGLQAASGYHPNTAMIDGRWLWFCTRAGVVTADMRAAGSNTVAPKASIEVIRVDGRELPATGSLRFGPQPGVIDFELGAMSFRLPEKVQVFHRIAGVDRDWVEAGPDRVAHYPRLPAGFHMLQVRAVNEDGVPSEREATLAFHVVPTFWETTAFRLAVLTLAVGLLLIFGRFLLLRSLRKETEMLREQAAVNGERVRIARDMHDQIGASLTQVSLLTELIQADGVEDKRISQLARTVRQVSTSLDEIVWAVNPRHDHLGSVLEYLGQQAMSLLEPAGLRCRLEFPDDAPDRHLPAEFRHQVFLIVREALNNVIKHASATQVTVSAEVTPQRLRVRVADNGRGGASGKGGDGLGNMRARAKAVGGTCEILSATGEGTVVDLELPWPQRPRSS